jgi:hypothetical protein
MSSLNKGRTALLVIDAQNSILDERGLAAGGRVETWAGGDDDWIFLTGRFGKTPQR